MLSQNKMKILLIVVLGFIYVIFRKKRVSENSMDMNPYDLYHIHFLSLICICFLILYLFLNVCLAYY